MARLSGEGSAKTPPQLLLMKDESVIPYSQYCEVISDVAREQHRTVGRLEELLKGKFPLVTSVCKDTAEWPNKFYYHPPQTKPPDTTFYWPIIHIHTPVNVVSSVMKSKWLSLNEAAQDKLYMLLTTGITLWYHLRYDPGKNDSSKWGYLERVNASSVHTLLQRYGAEMPHSTDVLSVVSRGRTKSEMGDCLKRVQDGSIGDTSIAHVWERALTSGMSNVNGRLAVFMLLDAIIGLRHGLTEELDHVEILHVKSSLVADSVLLTSPSEEVISFSIDSSPSPPPQKRQKYEERQKDKKRQKPQKPYHSDSSSGQSRKWDYDYPERPIPETRTQDSPLPQRNNSCDLKVASYSSQDNTAKYIILVEIHSEGETTPKKFMEELVHVLQNQSEVFGLYFEASKVVLYKARRCDDAEEKKITIEHQDYPLFEAHYQDAYFFSVCKFQRLVMDVFSCVLDGLANIRPVNTTNLHLR